MIDSRAIVDPSARLAEDVKVGPWTIIGPNVEIGAGTTIAAHCVIQGPTKIGRNNHIYQFCSIGELPQDKKFSGEKTFLEIGDNNYFREYCTVHRGTEHGGGITRIGNDNFFMAYVHVAHDCIVGNNTNFINHAAIAGHVTVADNVILSGFAGVHQFCIIGAYSFIGDGCKIKKDVLPYVLVGHPSEVYGLNIRGLLRNGFSKEQIKILKDAYKIVFRDGLTVQQAVEQLEKFQRPEIKPMIELLQKSERGIVR